MLDTIRHITNDITHKAHARANLILRCFSSRDRTLLVKAFCTYVCPLLEYCTPVWTPQYRYLIEFCISSVALVLR